jgi:hypothetical protein
MMNDNFSPLEGMGFFGVGRNKGIDSFPHISGRECIEFPESLTPQLVKPALDLIEQGALVGM